MRRVIQIADAMRFARIHERVGVLQSMPADWQALVHSWSAETAYAAAPAPSS